MTQTIDGALDRLAQLHPKLIDLGLDRTFAILEKLGNPHQALPPTIHLAGTNGKGSTAAFLSALAQADDKRVHVYASPHLVRFHERIRLANHLISDTDLLALLEEVEAANGGADITFFEVTTAAAMLAFSRVPADLLVLETGLGGKLDSTNVLEKPAATIITPIARDHEHFLGSDLAGIARQKAGIMRRDVPCLIAKQKPEVAEALREEAAIIGAPLFQAGIDFDWKAKTDGGFTLSMSGRDYALPAPALVGPHQIDNAALAVAALLISGQISPSPAAFSGLTRAVWPARVQNISHGKLAKLGQINTLILDGAHNAHGAQALKNSLADLSDQKWSVIFGALNTRPAAEFLAMIKPICAKLVCLTIPDQDAALSADELALEAQRLGIDASPAASLTQAMKAIEGAEHAVICGSLYLGGHVLAENETLPE